MADVEWAIRQPHPALRPLITRYIGYTQHDVTLGVHRGLPSRHVTLVISLADPIRISGMPRREQTPGRFAAPLGGLHLAPALVTQDRFQSGIHVELDPLGVPALFGVPAAALSGQVLDLADVGSRALARLPERLAEAPGWDERFTLLDTAFRTTAERWEPAREVGWAWQRLVVAGGQIRVAALADEIGWSRRHFTERFRRDLGLTPKQAARVLRFERAGELLRRSPAIDLALIATRCGYYDQAHLSNEWREFAGCSPGTWIAQELPFLQDDTSAGVAHSSV